MIKLLPNDIKMNVCRYLIGSPTNIKLNNNKALKQIQNKYRIYKTKSESHNEINEDIITFTIEGYNLNFDILYKYKDEIMNIFQNYDYAYLFFVEDILMILGQVKIYLKYLCHLANIRIMI